MRTHRDAPGLPADENAPLELLGVTAMELARAACGWFGAAKGAGLARAVYRDAHRQGRFAPQHLGAGPRAAASWRERTRLTLPEVTSEAREDGEHGPVVKRVLRLADGKSVESVALPMGRGRSSLCVSTQVGCARACTFCETGRMGLVRNLTAAEIVAQVVVAAQQRRPDSIVFQGMGEPLDNLDALLQALRVLSDPVGLAYAQERLTVCTVGHVPGIQALAELGWKRLGLSLSLTSADDARRAQLMPRSVRYPLAAIQHALIAYRQRDNLALGLHWCLLPGVNDGERDADELQRFAAPLGRAFVHVIPYNPGTAPIARAPEEHEVERFVARLRERGLAVRRRITKGRAVMAGCGQLGATEAAGARAPGPRGSAT